MPKKPGAGWTHVAGDARYSSYLQRVGNLLGLEQPINAYVKNKDFVDKYSNTASKGYVDSKMTMPSATSTYLDKGNWSFKSIEDRQTALASTYAIAVWPLS